MVDVRTEEPAGEAPQRRGFSHILRDFQQGEGSMQRGQCAEVWRCGGSLAGFGE